MLVFSIFIIIYIINYIYRRKSGKLLSESKLEGSVWKVIDFVCDVLYATLVEYVSPVFMCTHYYSLSSSEIDELRLPYIGREASCYSPIRVVHLMIGMILVSIVILASTYVFGLTSRSQHQIYLNNMMCEDQKKKTLLHELMHCYLWEYGINAESFHEENVCDIFASAYSVAKPIYEKYFKEGK